LKYFSGKFRGEIYTRYNGWKLLKDYSKSGEDNLLQATPDGTPPWLTLNFRTEWQISELLKLQVGMENLLDRHYRYFASGISAPGRNLIIALRVDI
jgi:hemoglobin/transferrin/lactoferrin receptor protein